MDIDLIISGPKLTKVFFPGRLVGSHTDTQLTINKGWAVERHLVFKKLVVGEDDKFIVIRATIPR